MLEIFQEIGMGRSLLILGAHSSVYWLGVSFRR